MFDCPHSFTKFLLAAFLGTISCTQVGCNKVPSPPVSPAAVGSKQPSAVPPATSGLELQSEDYAQARSRFQTKLLRKAPSPQAWEPVRPPEGVTVVEYPSGKFRLKAWTDNAPSEKQKRPAVLFLHGGWAFGEDDWEMAQPFRDAGFVVLMPILRGENGQPGFFSMFYDEVDDVLAAGEHLAMMPSVDPGRIYLSGHSAGGTLTLLAAMATKQFRAAASLSGSPDQVSFVRAGWSKAVPFDQEDIREFQLRSAVAYATSFKCPLRLYHGSKEPFFHDSSLRTALLAKSRNLDVEVIEVPGDHMSCVPEAIKQSIEFFRQNK